MGRSQIKLLVAGTVVAAAVGILVYAGVQKAEKYYPSVDVYLSDPALRGERAIIRGKVAAEGLVIKAGDRTATFRLQGDQKSMPVVFKGSIPDLFRAGAEVTVKGRLGADDTFQADQLITTCPSKYRALSPDAPASQPEGHS